MLKKSSFYLLFLCLFGSTANAVDFVVDDKPNEQLASGYVVQEKDVVGGYPIFQADGGWRLVSTSISSASGPQRSLPMPQVLLNRTQSGKVVMSQSVRVTLYGDGASSGWTGDPCSGEKIVKINRLRGRLDRCATAELVNIRVDNKPTDILKIVFTETNSGGRYYSTTLYVNIEAVGLSYSVVTSKDNEFNSRLSSWMETMLDAVAKAAGYDKPLNAYAGVPSLSSVLSNRRSGGENTANATVANPPSSVSKPESLPIAIRWDGYAALISGNVALQESGTKGIVKLTLPRGDGDCTGNYQLLTGNKGPWAISCTNGMASTGTFEAFGNGKASMGSGTDTKGNRVEFTIGSGG